MSKVYRISLICVMVVAMIALCILIYRYEEKSVPNTKYPEISDISGEALESHNFQGIQASEGFPKQEDLLTAAGMPDITTSDTELVIIEIYPRGISRQITTVLPGQLTGLSRDDMEQFLEEYCMNPDGIDVEKGLYRIGLTEFSGSSVTIEKCYHRDQKDYFYLVFVDDYVTVYCEDKNTVLLNTEIHRDQLPADICEEILNYKLIAGEEELFDFLETYTS